MDKKIDKNLHFTRILSLISAIILWFYVAYSENPEVEIWIRGVPISFTNQDVLKNNSLAVINDDDLTEISIKVKGQRASVGELADRVLTATVDLSGITTSGKYDLPINVTLPSNSVSVTKRSAYEIGVHVDKVSQVSKSVSINIKGDKLPDGMTIISSPETVSLKGPESITKNLSPVVETAVSYDGSVDTDTPQVVLINQDGTKYTGSDVELIDKTVKLSARKDLSLTADIAAPEGITIKSAICEPGSVNVKGSITDIYNAENLILNNLDINWNTSPATVSNIKVPLPENISLAEDINRVTVKIEFDKTSDQENNE